MAGMAVSTIIQPATTTKAEVQRRGKCLPQNVVKSKGFSFSSAFCARPSSNNVHGKLTRIARRKTKEVRLVGAIAASSVSTVGRDAKSVTSLRISETFAELRKKGQGIEQFEVVHFDHRQEVHAINPSLNLLNKKVAFIPYLTAGDPNVETTVAAVKLLENCGADIIELGVPYSDPLADGPVIHACETELVHLNAIAQAVAAAATRAISGGTNLDSVLTLIREGLSDIKVPIVIFLYYNLLLKRGVRKFLEEAKAAGASGLVVPDIPLEETRILRKLASSAGLELVLLTTPTTPTVRMRAIADASQGFIYLVSLTGVSGARASIDARVEGLVKNIKKASDKPVAVGFGVSTPEQAAKLAEWGADGVIIGSKVVELLAESESPEEGLRAVEDFAVEVRAALAPRNPLVSPHD